MRVDNSLLAGIAASSDAAKTTSKSHKSAGTTTSFSSALKSATSTTGSDSTSSKKTSTAETTKAVEGHPYADITGGPRSGLYLNTSGNARDGEAFVMVKRNGREYHIYGTGSDRTVIGLKTEAERAATTTTPAPGTTTGTAGTSTTAPASTLTGS
jgi:hypothetical protein